LHPRASSDVALSRFRCQVCKGHVFSLASRCNECVSRAAPFRLTQGAEWKFSAIFLHFSLHWRANKDAVHFNFGLVVLKMLYTSRC